MGLSASRAVSDSFIHRFSATSKDYLEHPHAFAEKNLQRFSSLQSLDLVAVVLNRHADVVFLNEFGCALLEVSFEQVVGQNWMTHFIPDNQRAELMRAFDLLTKGVTEPYQTYYNDVQTQSGNIIALHWVNQFIFADSGEVIGSFSLGSEQPELLDTRLLNKFSTN